MAVLMLCLSALLVGYFTRFDPGLQPAQAAAPTPTAESTPAPTPVPTPTPEPTPEPDWSQPVPEGKAVDPEEWFADAVFIGDSRTDGLKLYSGITSQAAFLDYTGITVYDVLNGKTVIRSGDKKISILDALAQHTYGKVYISLGVNELGYYDAEGFAETYAQIIDAIRDCQPEALVYVQSIIPVNTAKCKANQAPYYVTNEGIASYNEALAAMCAEKEVRLIAVDQALVDEEGQVPSHLSADGVHFKKEGYTIWLDYLSTHTGT